MGFNDKRPRFGRLVPLGLFVAVALNHHPARADNPNDILIVVNTNVGENQIPIDVVRDIFLKRVRQWKDTGRLIPINPKNDSPLRRAFQAAVLEMDPAQETRYWQERKMRAGDVPPPSLGYNFKAVFRIKGAISYVFRQDYIKGVSKIVLVIPAKR